MKKGLKFLTAMLTVVAMVFVLASCSGKGGNTTSTPVTSKHEKNPVVTIEMETGDKIVMELYPDVAPQSVDNFVTLVQDGFYDGVVFHRIIDGFMIQGGDPDGTGTGGPGYSIKGEFSSNGFENDLKHTAGVLSMARSSSPDSGGSQFFIMHKDSPHLDGEYAAFGKVIEGMDVVNKLAEETPVVDGNGTVEAGKEPKMKKVTVDTFGETYDAPVKM